MVFYDRCDKGREEELYRKIVWEKMPAHIAVIMDGNGRWATERDLPRIEGHRIGADVLRDVLVFSAKILKLDVFTVYAFSTENWKRPAWEVDFLMSLPHKFLREDIGMLMDNNIRFRATGETEKLPEKARGAIEETLKETASNTGMVFNLAINYGSRSEIVETVKKIAVKLKNGELEPEVIDEDYFSGELFTAGLPDPDLLIRTSGERRISNFLLWQIAYTEISFLPVYWPDFDRFHLMEAVIDFQKRKRRYGGVEDK